MARYSHLLCGIHSTEGQLPFVYHPDYNVTAWGCEQYHPFDTEKWGKIVDNLKNRGVLPNGIDNTVQPTEATKGDLLEVHTEKYLSSLNWSFNLAKIAEVPVVAVLPNALLQPKLLRPMRLQTGGTVLACHLAREFGWAINIGGGFHHCSKTKGGGFCFYADIQLGIKYLLESEPKVSKVLIVDLDAHQGNGYQHDFPCSQNQVVIMDAFNADIYPQDINARGSIKYAVYLETGTSDEKYLQLVKEKLVQALDEETPSFVFYNAGSDILSADPLGQLMVSPRGIMERDEMVFAESRQRNIPVVMVTSGGYKRISSLVVADSIENLWKKGLLDIKSSSCP